MRKLTKRALAGVFMDMCEEVPLKEISVTDFISYAGISRQTLYNYFKDKADLMNYVYEVAVEKIVDNMAASVFGMYYGAEKMAQVCLENRNFYVQLSKYKTQNDFTSYFIHHVEGVYCDKLAQNAPDSELSERLRKILHLFCTGACMFFVEWMQNGMHETPEQMADVIVACMPEEIKSRLQEKTVSR